MEKLYEDELDNSHENKENATKKPEKKDNEIAEKLDGLHASIDDQQQKNIFEKQKKKETHEIQKDINDLKSTVHVKNKSPLLNPSFYETMPESDITRIAQQGRAHAAERVETVVQKSSWIPSRIKKMAA